MLLPTITTPDGDCLEGKLTFEAFPVAAKSYLSSLLAAIMATSQGEPVAIIAADGAQYVLFQSKL